MWQKAFRSWPVEDRKGKQREFAMVLNFENLTLPVHQPGRWPQDADV